jgi:hypothetical protein
LRCARKSSSATGGELTEVRPTEAREGTGSADDEIDDKDDNDDNADDDDVDDDDNDDDDDDDGDDADDNDGDDDEAARLGMAASGMGRRGSTE